MTSHTIRINPSRTSLSQRRQHLPARAVHVVQSDSTVGPSTVVQQNRCKGVVLDSKPKSALKDCVSWSKHLRHKCVSFLETHTQSSGLNGDTK